MTRQYIKNIYTKSLVELVETAHRKQLKNFPIHEIQGSSLLSVKTGGCPEDCAYCPQSARYQSGVAKQKLMSREEVMAAAQKAKEALATRFCMGAAWRSVKEGDEFEAILAFIKDIKNMGLEVCCTLGMLNLKQAQRLKAAGLDFYNHNIDSSRNFYPKIIKSHSFDDRLNTIKNVRLANIAVCTGGILGMGENDDDRIDFIFELFSLDPPPESITINILTPFLGTPLAEKKPLGIFELVRVMATLRITCPKSMIRLSAGRMQMSDEGQFLCFYSGANSIFLGDKLLTSENPSVDQDKILLENLGYHLKEGDSHAHIR